MSSPCAFALYLAPAQPNPFPPAQIMTTNQPEQLDPTMVAALIRPGRIDK